MSSSIISRATSCSAASSDCTPAAISGRASAGPPSWRGGTLGNALNVLIQPGRHLAIGASTAVFAALGLLVAFTWRRGFWKDTPWRTRIAPVTAGIGLLAFTGTGSGVEGDNVDVLAHLTGFGAGFGLGVLMARLELPQDADAQRWWGAVAIGAVVLAWMSALG